MRYNSKIEETLDLPSMETLMADELTPDMENTLALAEQAGRSLIVQDGDGHSQAMDQIHKETLKTAKDLVDLGFNVDQRSAATIFEKANLFYETALRAKDAKRDMELRAMKLMLDSRKLDLEQKKLNHEMGELTIDADAIIIEDRNEIIRRARDQTEP
jgi:hypothetical protein